MSSTSTQSATSRKMNPFEPRQQILGDNLKGDSSPNTGVSSIIQYEYTSRESPGPSRNGQDGDLAVDKVGRRLAQNREAARKSRIRKKAYLQQLETSRVKLLQLEQELEKAKQQGLYIGGMLGAGRRCHGAASSGIATFEIEYGHWVDEQQRQISEIRSALQARVSDLELRMLVENGLSHYKRFFRMKGDAAKADVFYLMSGMWRTSAERFFLWIGGFRPSELLNILTPQLGPLTERQLLDISKMRESSQLEEDNLSRGIDEFLQVLAQSIASEPPGTENHGFQMTAAAEKLDELEAFVSKADELRERTLEQVSSILTTRQGARGLLLLGEYFHRLRTLSSLWAARPRDHA